MMFVLATWFVTGGVIGQTYYTTRADCMAALEQHLFHNPRGGGECSKRILTTTDAL